MRNYAQILTSIWRDPEFKALDAGAQRTYLMLVTQANISAAGTLDITVKRWADLATDTTPASIEADLSILDQAQFACFDEATEELLVRSFIRHDKAYTNPKRLGNIINAALLIDSPRLRGLLWVELKRLEIAHHLNTGYVSAGESLSDRQNPETGIGDAKISRFNRLVVTTDLSKRTRNQEPETEAADAALRARGRTRVGAPEAPPDPLPPPGLAENILAEWTSGLRRRPMGDLVTKVGLFIHGALAEGQAPDDIRETLRRWQDRGNLGPGVLPSMLHEVANAPAPGSALAVPGNRRRSPADERVAEGLALAAELETQEGMN